MHWKDFVFIFICMKHTSKERKNKYMQGLNVHAALKRCENEGAAHNQRLKHLW